MSDYSNIKPFQQLSFRATVERDGLVRFTDGFSDGVAIYPSQIPALVIWLQQVQLAPFKAEPEFDQRAVFDPGLETCKPLTPEEMRKLERVREMMGERRKLEGEKEMMDRLRGDQWTPEQMANFEAKNCPPAEHNRIEKTRK